MINLFGTKKFAACFLLIAVIQPVVHAYKPASPEESDAINAAIDGDMRKAFIIMKDYIEKAFNSGNPALAKQGLDFLKGRDLIASQAISDITVKNVRDQVCDKGFVRAIEEAKQQLDSKYAEVAPEALLAEKKGIISAIYLKYRENPDAACSGIASDPVLKAAIQADIEVEEKRLEAAREKEILKEEARKRRQAPYVMRHQWGDLEFCTNYGRFLRGHDFSEQLEGGGLASVFSAEAKRRRLSLDMKAAKEELIRIGMNECSLYAVMAYPKQINRSIGGWGERRQYWYGGDLYVYMQNGRVTALHN